MDNNILQRMIEIGRCTPEEAAAQFDACDPVSPDFMLGAWRGGGLETGHPMDGLLEQFGWHGKRFESSEKVHPLVFDAGNGRTLTLEPRKLFAGMGLNQIPGLARSGAVKTGFRLLMGLMKTSKPAARLRETSYRGKTTATMIYDRLPINDVFVRVDDNTVLGVMDLRGLRQPFYFWLKREAAH